MRPLRPLSVALAGAIALGAVASAFATGLISTGGAGGGYTACVDNQNGNARIVPDGAGCRAQEHAILLAGSTPLQKTITINCAAGDDITNTIAQTRGIPEVEVVIDGTCRQFVDVARDNVTFVPAHPGDGLVAPDNSRPALTTIDPARQIDVEGLTIGGGIYAGGSDLGLGNVTISGGGVVAGNGRIGIGNSTIDGAQTGISADDGSVVTAFGVTISNSAAAGVQSSGNATVSFKNSAITNSGFQGVQVANGGAVFLHATTVSGSGDLGVYVGTGGTADIHESAIRGNRGGVGVAGSAVIQNAHVTENRLFGVQGYGGRVEIQGSTIDQNLVGPFPGSGYGVVGLLGSRISIGNTTIANNASYGVELSGGSVATFDNLASSGNGGAVDVHCSGGFSSIAGPSIVPATTNCPSSG